MKPNNKVARVVGMLFLAGMIIGIAGNILIQSVLGAPDYISVVSANSMKIAIGSVLLLMTVVGDVAHGILMFPILKKYNGYVAAGYLGFRILDAVFLGIQVLFILLQVPISGEYMKAGGAATTHFHTLGNVFIKANIYSYQIGMIAVGIAGLILCYSFYWAKLVPRFVAVWGFVGYLTILFGSLLEISGFDLGLIHTIPGGLWELFIGVWLIVKGFNSSPIVSGPVKKHEVTT